MAYNEQLANKVRKRLSQIQELKVTEKKMFGGLAFLANHKMCIHISGENLMCRFDPNLDAELQKQKGYLPMIMRGKHYKGYCYVAPIGFKREMDFEYWITLCVDFNKHAKSSKKY